MGGQGEMRHAHLSIRVRQGAGQAPQFRGGALVLQGGGQVGHLQGAFGVKSGHAVQAVLQLADVAWPVVGEERRQKLFAKTELGQAQGMPAIQEVIDEQRDVLFVFAQGRQVNHHHVEAIEEVLAKTAGGDLRLEVAMGGGHDAEITLRQCKAPTARNSPSWMSRSSLTCISSGRSPISSKKAVPPSASSTSPFLFSTAPLKAPLTWPKQLAFHERADQRAAVDGDKLTARVGVVHGPRHHLFAGAALTQQQHRKPVARNLRNEPPQGADLRRLAHQTVSAARREPIHGTPRPSRLHRINSYNEGGGFLTSFFTNPLGQAVGALLGASEPASTRHKSGVSARWIRRAEP